MADNSQISRGVVFANLGDIFLKRDIKHPVTLIFNTPIAAYTLGKALNIAFGTRQTIALLKRWRLIED